jgi:hypothetical protein
MRNSRFYIFKPTNMTGEIWNSRFEIQGLDTVSGIMWDCDIYQAFNAAFSGTIYSSDFRSGVGGLSAPISGVFHNCKFRATIQASLTNASAGSWTATSIGCTFTYLPFAGANLKTYTKPVLGKFLNCDILLLEGSSNQMPPNIGSEFIGCNIKANIAPTSTAKFTSCVFNKSFSDRWSMFAPPRSRPAYKSKLLAGTQCTVSVYCTYSLHSAEFVQAGDTIEVKGVGFEYDGVFTVDSIASGTGGYYAITYTNTAVTADESEVATSPFTNYYVTWVDAPNTKCDVNGCHFIEPTNTLLQGLCFSEWQQVDGRNNTFSTDLVQTVSYPQKLKPYQNVVHADATGGGEVSEAWVVSSAFAGGEYFDIEDQDGTVRVWLDLDGGSTPPSTPAGGRLIQGNIITGNSITVIAGVIATAVNNDSKFEAFTDFGDNSAGFSRIVIICKDAGDRTDITTSDASLISVRKTTDGSDSLEITLRPSANMLETTIMKSDASVNSVSVNAEGSETISGSLTTDLFSQYESIDLYSDGSNMFIK